MRKIFDKAVIFTRFTKCKKEIGKMGKFVKIPLGIQNSQQLLVLFAKLSTNGGNDIDIVVFIFAPSTIFDTFATSP